METSVHVAKSALAFLPREASLGVCLEEAAVSIRGSSSR